MVREDGSQLEQNDAIEFGDTLTCMAHSDPESSIHLSGDALNRETISNTSCELESNQLWKCSVSGKFHQDGRVICYSIFLDGKPLYPEGSNEDGIYLKKGCFYDIHVHFILFIFFICLFVLIVSLDG